MGNTKAELVALSDEVWNRTRARVEGLTDDEYLWEPAPGCWTIRRRDDGTWTADWPMPRPDPEPFTTIAWRLWHLIDMYGEDRAPNWLDVPPQGEAVGFDAPDRQPPSTAAAAIAMLERAHDRWDSHLDLVTESQLAELVGPVGGQYADRTKASYVMHMLDEFIHHGAEIGVLRDLWRWQHASVGDDPITDRTARGDMSLLDDLGDDDLGSEMVDRAVAYGRWDLAVALIARGAPISTTGRTPLHMAAGAGELAAVKLLVEHGADPSATDPDFQATPLQWAEFLGHRSVADHLRALGG